MACEDLEESMSYSVLKRNGGEKNSAKVHRSKIMKG